MSNGRLDIVIGGQLGSEGKGNYVNHVASEYDIHVRVGGPNAGHSYFFGDEKCVSQSVPCGWTNKESWLVLGAGAIIEPDTLIKELARFDALQPGVRGRVFVDGNASILSHDDHKAEGGVDGELHRRIGSTGEGVGAARLGRLGRDETKHTLARDCKQLIEEPGIYIIEDSQRLLTQSIKRGKNVLLEGTQGSGLSFIHGPWPYCTTSETNASGILADCGLAPQLVTGVLLVVRTYPIRVAGNSGPLYKEISWEELSRRLGKEVHEKTTVTKKTRRVGEWDPVLFKKAVSLNQPTAIALGFLDYINPADEGKTDYDSLSRESKDFIHEVEFQAAEEMGWPVPVVFAGTGGPKWSIVDRRNHVPAFGGAVEVGVGAIW